MFLFLCVYAYNNFNICYFDVYLYIDISSYVYMYIDIDIYNVIYIKMNGVL